MKRTLIRVTKKHIAHNSHAASNCPVALAISNAIGGLEVSVVSRNVEFMELGYPFDRPGSKFSIRTTRWIRKYDAYKPVNPFNFYLRVPEILTHAPS